MVIHSAWSCKTKTLISGWWCTRTSGLLELMNPFKTRTFRALLWENPKSRNSSRHRKSRSKIQSSRILTCRFTILRTRRRALIALMIIIIRTRIRKEVTSPRSARAKRFSPNRSIERSQTHQDVLHTRCNLITPRKTNSRLRMRTNSAK